MSTPGLRCFDYLARCIARKGQGLSHLQLRDLGALVRELEEPEPNLDRVAELLDALGLTEDDVEAMG